ncbi:16S rRNA (uracil(1498)-N(3))-methyltransferase [Actinomyces sp. zg-332]|uniref:16S rRNA (uracil(1498)-N(3))-methyltransferase n=1 Tax=Actinomyces sp. zg-332 TaxID=2708340 RepID=UPI0014215AC7|nr:16S rRNA (uracil(1498)-N(3))-methyltransferase [Actinomyces sp. zg-332]QPK94485.1 16S rRNA (uracil(1498)-N(3))-methyltransferase [Actinomyces sp. zg-332]
MTYPVFIQPDRDLDILNVGEKVSISGTEAHHAIAVMRLKNGDITDIVDGRGTRLRSRIVHSDKTQFTAEIIEKITDEPKRIQLHLVQALAKGSRDEQAVESCVELGVKSITPWKAERCVSVWVGNKVQKSIAKWQSLVFAATKQSRQSYLPAVNDLCDSKKLSTFIEEKQSDKVGFFVLHESADNYLSDLPQKLFDTYEEIYIIVGPEGGITENELEMFTQKGAIKVRLSDSVLRTSNAGNVAIAMIGAKANLWTDKS